MFGFRPDGRRVKGVDPIIRMTPYIMTKRSDAQVFTTQYIDAEILSDYMNEKRKAGVNINHMDVIVAAWLRAVCEAPMVNRFVIGKTLYARNELALSFVVLKGRGREGMRETVCKLYFDPRETIFEVHDKIERAVAKCRESTTNSMVNRLANALLSLPAITGPVVGLLKLLDRYGLLPKAIIDASPFHTSLFISNMASIKMNSIYHHIYDFGSTSIFMALGRKEWRAVGAEKDGTAKVRQVYPMDCVVDERIMPGAQYGMSFAVMSYYFRHPERLEQPPERVLDDGVDFSLKESYRNKM